MKAKTRTNQPVTGVKEIAEQVVEADKEVISKIKREYVEENDVTHFLFPKGVMPLSITLNTHQLFILEGLVGSSGVAVEGYEMDDYYYNGEGMELDIVGDLTDEVIGGLVYVSYDKEPLPVILDTYHIFYPYGGKEKFYLHSLSGSTLDGITIIMNDEKSIDFSVVDTPLKLMNYLDTKQVLSFVDSHGQTLYWDGGEQLYNIILISNGGVDVVQLDDWVLTEVVDTVTLFN